VQEQIALFREISTVLRKNIVQGTKVKEEDGKEIYRALSFIAIEHPPILCRDKFPQGNRAWGQCFYQESPANPT